jgi:hypothetical protein
LQKGICNRSVRLSIEVKKKSATNSESFWIPLCLQSYLLSFRGTAAKAGSPKTLLLIQYIGLDNWNTGMALLLLIYSLRLRIGLTNEKLWPKNCEVTMSEVTLLSAVEIAWPQAKEKN